MNDDNKNKEKEDFHEQEVTKEVEKIEDIEMIEESGKENSVEDDVEKDDIIGQEEAIKTKEKNNKKKKIVIISLVILIVLILATWILLSWKKNSNKEKIKDEVYKEEKLTEKEIEKKIKKYGDALEKVISTTYAKENKILTYEEAIKNINNDDDINCNVHEIYNDLKVYLNECSLNGRKTKYSYGKIQNIIDDKTMIVVYANKNKNEATLIRPTDISNYDTYVVKCDGEYSNAVLLKNTVYVFYQDANNLVQMKNYVTNEKILSNIEYNSILPFEFNDSYNTEYVAVNKNNKWKIYNINTNKAVTSDEYDTISANSAMGPSFYVVPVKGTNIIACRDKKCGLINYTTGKKIIPFIYSNIRNNGNYLMASYDNSDSGVVYDLDGNKILANQYNKIYGVTSGGYLLVNKNDTILLVNTNGNVIYNFGSSLGLDKINYIMEYNRSLIFQFHKTNDLEKCVEYNYNLNTKTGDVADTLCGGIDS